MKNILNKTARGLLLVCALMITLSAYAQQININVKNSTLESVLKTITQQTGYRFTYTDAIDAKRVVSANASNVAPLQFFKTFFGSNGISYKVSGKMVSLSPQKTVSGNTSKQTVKGKVTDENGETIPGAAVRNITTNVITVSGMDGQYTIAASEGDQLQFTAIGMEDFTATVGKSDVINAVLPLDIVALDDVVVTGYQTISKERNVASYDIVLGDDMKAAALSKGSILDGLEGMATGLAINNSADAESKYSIRGLTSINSSKEPLFVVDGVPMSSEDLEYMLSPNDIASVTVLKDATAVSIWGSRAANGVVVVVSRKGSDSKGKINVTYDNNFTIKGKPSISYYNLMDSKTFVKNVTEIFELEGYQLEYPWSTVTNQTTGLSYQTYNQPVVFPHEQILYDYTNGNISLDERDRRLNQLASQDGLQAYGDEFLSNAWNHSHTLSVSGGSEKFSIFGSLGYEGDKGLYHNNNDDYKINVRQDYKITPWLKWDLTLNGAITQQKGHVMPFSGYEGMATSLMNLLPYATFRNNDGSWANFADYYMYEPNRQQIYDLTGISSDWYPVKDFYDSFTETKGFRLRVNTGLTINIVDGLQYEGRFQYLQSSTKSETYIPENTWQIRSQRINALDSYGEQLLPKKGGDYTLLDYFNSDWTVRNQLAYNRGFNDNKHQVTALAGLEYRQEKINSYNSFTRGYNYQTMAKTVYDITAARNAMYNYFGNFISLDIDGMTPRETVLRYTSYYANLAYTFNQKYSINGSVRIDQSNLFGTDVNDQYKPIGSVGLAWNIHKEKFMGNADWVNNLTLRASYGFSGNSPDPDSGGPFDILVADNDDALQGESGFYLSSPANTMLTWEKTRTWNIGVDFGFLNGRIAGTVDVYDKKTTDLLGQKPVDLMTGYSTVYANVGSLSNKGIEVSLQTHNVKSKNFNWYSNLNVSYNKNKVLDYYLSPSDMINTALSQHYVPGYPAGALFALDWAGLRSEDGAPQVYNSKGEVELQYYNLTTDDVIFAGNVIPKWTGAFTNKFSYKNLELTAMIVFNLGHKMITTPSLQLNGRFNYNRVAEFDQRWREPGDEAFTDIPSAFYDPYYMTERSMFYSDDFFRSSNANIQSASYAKLRELTLSYSLPKGICQKIKAQGVKIRASAHNLFGVYANDKNIDPESFSLYSGMRSDNYKAYYSFGLSINF